MHYAYVGDHESVVLYGVTFQRGFSVDVTDQKLLHKLAGNCHFVKREEPAFINKPRGRPPRIVDA